jgi:hypothetical protein
MVRLTAILLLLSFTSFGQAILLNPTNKSVGTPSVDNNIYADPAASGLEDGTSAHPYNTGQEALDAWSSGKTVYLKSGTYRETLTPQNGCTIVGESATGVVISGLEDVGTSGWTVYSGTIYQKTISLPVTGYATISGNTGLAANQIFKDGDMQPEGRWPNVATVEEQFDRTKWRYRASTSSFTSTGISDASLPNSTGSLRRVIVAGWYETQSQTITSSSSGSITYSSLADTDPNFIQRYYVTGAPEYIDITGEWHYNGTILLYKTASGSPTGLTYKARNYGFDLSSKTGVSISNISLYACEINGNSGTASNIIDGCNITYSNHTVTHPSGDVIYTNANTTGFKLYGASNQVKNCHFKYSASTGIWAGASANIDRNQFEWMGYDGNYGAPVLIYGRNSNGQQITRNTGHHFGRSFIDFGPDSNINGSPDKNVNRANHYNIVISYNNIYNYGMLSSDGGAIYGSRFAILTGTAVHHNWIHNSLAEHYANPYDVGINAGIYYDQSTAAGTINHHNVLWDNVQADFHVVTDEIVATGITWMGKARFYNNTMVTNPQGTNQKNGYYSWLDVSTADTTHYDVLRNNIARARVVYNYSTDTSVPINSPLPWYYEAGPGNNSGVVYGGESPSTMWNNATNNFYFATAYKPYTLQPVKFAGDPTDAVQNVGTVADPAAYFQLGSASGARGIGTTLTGYNDGDTNPKDAGGYYYSQTAWNTGYNCTVCP